MLGFEGLFVCFVPALAHLKAGQILLAAYTVYAASRIYPAFKFAPLRPTGMVGYRQKFWGLTLKGRISTSLAPLTLSVGGYFNHL